ncbi:hypothetical protein HPB50_024092 [Hyalomma asiaticum]|uniref:Uncharacterized protein n=1 Tax=Hyalomma asiaticum TaxID=266040 RepID=A0ACB7SSM2_HYAAI|nr:hypothetical protein HPB50_024092 [Hyalomma asiaticum]
MAARAPRPAAPAARAAAAQRQSVGPGTTVGATTAGPQSKGYKDFADTVTSEIQAAGDQSQGMHDDPRNAYRTRKTYLLFIEIIMAVCVIALIVGTVVMFVVSSNSGTITLKGDSEPTPPIGHQNNLRPKNDTHNLADLEGDYEESSFTIS